MPTHVHSTCTRAGLPLARAGEIERALVVGHNQGPFGKVGPLSWRACDSALASQLALLLEGARLYRIRVHKEINVVEVVLTRPPAPNRVSRELESMLSGGWSFRHTKQWLTAIADGAQRSLVVMTTCLDGLGAAVVLNMFENTSASKKCLILRATRDGRLPEALHFVESKLVALGVEVVNCRLDHPGTSAGETLHAKTVLGDDDSAYLGSSNMNQWSFEYSLELGLYVRGNAAACIAELVQAIRVASRSEALVKCEQKRQTAR